MMQRRGKTLTAEEVKMYNHIYERTREQRDMFAKG